MITNDACATTSGCGLETIEPQGRGIADERATCLTSGTDLEAQPFRSGMQRLTDSLALPFVEHVEVAA
jgi:hypothetical protein